MNTQSSRVGGFRKSCVGLIIVEISIIKYVQCGSVNIIEQKCELNVQLYIHYFPIAVKKHDDQGNFSKEVYLDLWPSLPSSRR